MTSYFLRLFLFLDFGSTILNIETLIPLIIFICKIVYPLRIIFTKSIIQKFQLIMISCFLIFLICIFYVRFWLNFLFNFCYCIFRIKKHLIISWGPMPLNFSLGLFRRFFLPLLFMCWGYFICVSINTLILSVDIVWYCSCCLSTLPLRKSFWCLMKAFISHLMIC